LDIRRFTENSPGEVVAIAGGDHAYLPAPLPPAWRFPESLWPLLAEARQQVGMLEGLGRVLPNPGLLLRPAEDREALQTSRLEGTYVTARQLLLFEIEPREPEAATDPANDWKEVLNCRQALKQGLRGDLPLSLRLIRDLHRVLLTGVRGADRSPGEFRRVQVAIGSDRRFIPPPPERLTEHLYALETYLHNREIPFDPLVDCFLVHYQFEAIHPFVDGNGRVGRLLLSMMLQTACSFSKPWLHLSEYFEESREEYAARLFDVSATANWTDWIAYCLRGCVVQARRTIERCEKLLALREDFVKRLHAAGGSLRLHRIVEKLFEYPVVRIPGLQKMLGIIYPTAAADVGRLVDANILAEMEDTRPKAFYSPEIFRVAYEGLDRT